MDDHELLCEYVERRSQEAFRRLVERHLPMVHSTARRLVRDAHLAEDVAQSVFTTLAQKAEALGRSQVVGGWLYNTTRHLALHAVRTEHRRREREQTAIAMQTLNLVPDDSRFAEHLEPAMAELDPSDRDALVLRYLENRTLRDVGAELGLSEDAARMRVNRALERLRTGFERQGVGTTTVLLGTALTATTTSVPAGLAATIATTALTATAIPTSAALATQALAMTTFQKTLVAAALVAASVTTTCLVQLPAQSRLRAENDALRRLQSEQAERFAAETKHLSNQLSLSKRLALPPTNDSMRELLKLRGEVARLRLEKATVVAEAKSGPSALSGLTATPEMRKAHRLQQKATMATVYKTFAQQMGLSKVQTEKFTDLLADDILENMDHVTAVLRNGTSREEMERLFAGQEAALREKVQAMLGPEGLAQYQDYNRDLVSQFTAEEFQEMLNGDDATKEAQARQLRQLMQEETQAVLANAGLNPQYQTLPILNFRNFACTEEAEKNLQLLETIYERVSARAGSFLSAEELAKFAEFRAAAIISNRAMLVIKRKLMAPDSK